DIEPISDERGFFARTFCKKEFQQRCLVSEFVQCSVSYNKTKGTLRGMHYQAAPHEETKIVSCTKGAIYDVVLDLRPESNTFKQWVAVELTATNYRSLYIPEGCAHGFITLVDDTEVYYQISEFYYPELSKGVRWDDLAFKIEWPGEADHISPRDLAFPPCELYNS
ncbi:MAG: dTDP-4-dehydrorhamnose 3,5-epimerase, partial [Lentisphaerae bacterium]|nr:dTDP-4-dehydrorhamnose 3,5-epimerase [Lentisphaerota bacterium]